MSERKKILVLCPSPFNTAATQRLKYEQYFDVFEENGFDMVVSSFQTQRFWNIIYKEGKFAEKAIWTIIGYFKRIFDLLRAPFYDGVFINLWITPLGWPLFEKALPFFNSKIIYDLDDMLFLNQDTKNKRFIDRLKGKQKPIALFKNASYVIVCTPTLEEFVKKYNEKVVDISSTFDTNRFIPVKEYSKKEITTIGWTGTHSTLKYLDLLKDVIYQVSLKRKIKLLVISDKKYDIPNVNCEWVKWTAENEISDLHKIEIGLYPGLKDKWSLGKSGLKALTYMSIGIPALATAWGANFRTIEHGVDGFLLNDDNDWVETIIKLIDDIELREKIGKKGREKVLNEFSVQANSIKYLKAFRESYN